jgi:hypothetical protein
LRKYREINMSRLNAEHTADRIRVAKGASPLIVQYEFAGDLYEAWFADTVWGQKYLKRPPTGFIGVLHGEEGVKTFYQNILAEEIFKHSAFKGFFGG